MKLSYLRLLLLALFSTSASAQVVINEIMFHPAHEDGVAEPTGDEYIELLNTGADPVSLAGWQIDRGVSFTFGNVLLQPDAFIVIAANVSAFQSANPGVSNVVGGWTGQLSNSGERIRLVDENAATVDSVSYADQGDWAQRVREISNGEDGWTWNSPADGSGSSLELRNPALSNNSGQNWSPGAVGGSPGAANAASATNIAPLIRKVAHSPAVPSSNEIVQVEADIDDETLGGETATLHWRVSRLGPQESFTQIPMEDNNANGRWEADIPAHPNGTVIEFYIEAGDGTNSRSWPAPTDQGQIANCLYQVDEETIASQGASYRLVMSVEENAQFNSINRQSDAQMNTTLIADDGSGPAVRYLCGNRVRGAGSRNRNPVSHRINLPRDDSWNSVTRMNLNAQYTWLQFVGMKLHTSSGLAAPETRRVQVRRNGSNFAAGQRQNYGSYVHVEPLGGEFVDNNLPNDNGGNLYKKVRPDVDWAYRNGNFQQYPDDGWSKSTNSAAADWTDLDEFLRVMNQATSDPDYIDQVEVVADLDQWMDWFATMTLLANGETNPSSGTDDDYSIYRGEIDQRIILVPHDLDTILGFGDESAISDPESTLFDMIEPGVRGDILNPLVPLFNNAQIRTRYFESLRRLAQTSFAKPRFDELLVNHLSGWVPQAEIDAMISWMDQRRAFVTAQANIELGPPPPLDPPTTTATLDSAHGNLMIHEVLAAGSPDAIELFNAGPGVATLDGMTLSDEPSQPDLFTIPPGTTLAAGDYISFDSTQLGFTIDTDGETITLYAPASGGGAVLESISFGLQIPGFSIGRSGPGSDTWALMPPTIGSANAAATALGSPATLRINEWLAQPDTRFKRDYIELHNPAADPVALGGLTITDDVNNDLSPFQLPPLSFIAADGFSVFHPVGNDAVPGEWDELPFRLSQDLDWITVLGANGVLVDQVHLLQQTPDVAQGRAPDGAADYAYFSFATPGLRNPQQTTQVADLVDWDATWKFDDSDTDLGTAWRNPSYDDSAWQSGQAALGVESDPLPIALVTPLAFQPPATHYFRHQFNFTGSAANTTLDLSTLVDDGGIVYLNGTEIARLRLPAQVNHGTFANTFVEAIIEGPFAVPDGLLLSGANTIAVETHQNTPDSSDIVFALKLGSIQQLPGTPAYAAAQQVLDSLRVTEIMYNPSGAVDDQEEFIEFQNIGPAAIELGGIRISDGVDFVFPAMTLDPGAYVMVVASVSGFQSKYGNSATIAGEYGGRLDNGGETIQLQLPPPFEANILCFSYDDDWYAGSDGDGSSLTMVQPDAPIGLWDKASGWIPSTTIGGTPGAIGAPVITSSLTASGIQGAPFQYGIIAANTPGSYGASGLPQGLSINTDSGVILGSSQLAGSFDVTITATNVTGTAQETLVINFAPQPAPQINSPLQVTTLISTPFSYQITATNQPNPFGAQNLPAWLGFDPGTGTLSGTPTTAASVEITISATNLTSTDTETLRIDVVSDPLAAAVDSVGLTWTSDGNTPWSETTAVSHDGVDSARAGPIGDRQNSLISTVVSGPDTLTFWWRLTQPGGFHGTTLSLSMDGTEQFRVSTGGFGNDPQVEWEQRSLNIPAGIHTVAWNLNTRAFGTTGGTAFLDEVTLLSQGGQPLITSPPSAQTVVGQPFSYQITASNDPTSFGADPLPPGLSVDANGLISGTPTAVGDTTVLLSATNDAGTRNQALNLRVTVPLAQALDTPQRIWTSGGAAAWISQVDTTHDQSDAGQSGAIGDNQESWVETEFTGPGTLEFWWNVSSENGTDVFRFELDGNQQGAISGTPGWQQRSVPIPAGNHTARWVFARNASGGNGTDTAWLDEVVFTPADGDGDGLADSWEIENFGNLSQSADGDFDGDGSSNLDEQAALTNPADAGDRFRITAVEPISIDLTELSWTSVAGQRYQVQASTSMGSWANVGSAIEAIGDATSLIVTPPGDSLSMLTLVGENAPARAFVPTSDIGTLWRGGDEAAFANQGGDTGWRSGSSGVGYEAGDGDYADFFGIDVQDIMADQRASVYLRVPFQINGSASASSLTLRMRYDDGFAAFLNGVPVASSNAPQNPTWNSAATGQHPDQDAVVFEDYDISAFTGSLQAGGNILAIHGMNDEAGSSDILVEPVLQADLSGSVDFGSGFWRIIVLGP